MYQYRATILRVVDGDTVHADVDLGFDAHQLMTLRLAGINAPEHGTPAGEAATVFLKGMLYGSLAVAAHDPNVITARAILETVKDRREKYGRYLAYIWPDNDRLARGPSINDQMVSSGHAVPYDGGKR